MLLVTLGLIVPATAAAVRAVEPGTATSAGDPVLVGAGDVTPLVTGNGTYGFALVPQSNDGIDFNSREASSNRPQLVVTTSGQ